MFAFLPNFTAFAGRSKAKINDNKLIENGGDKLVHGSGGISQPRAE